MILDGYGRDLPIVGEFDMDTWAILKNTQNDRILFSVPDGLLVVNIETRQDPYAQAYFPILGYPREILVHDMKMTFAAGRYGIYQFGLDVFNLD